MQGLGYFAIICISKRKGNKMTEYTNGIKRIQRFQKLQNMMDNATYTRTWLYITNLILDEKMKLGMK